jgi:hypothetical protein
MAVRLLAWKGRPDAEGGKPNFGAADKKTRRTSPTVTGPSLPPNRAPLCRLDGLDHEVIESHGLRVEAGADQV